MIRKKRILFCPLDWGLGHATRDSFLIRKFIGQGHEVILAGSGQSLEFLRKEFPLNQVIPFPGFQIRYNTKWPAWKMIAIQLPKIICQTLSEHRKLKKIILKHQVDLVISDARYGVWSSKVPSVLITHQLQFHLPFRFRLPGRLAARLNRFATGRFSSCWVPDFPGYPNLGGRLSHPAKITPNTTYIGPLSQFSGSELLPVSEFKYEVVALISGPEPQRTLFENLLSEQLAAYPQKSLIICGDMTKTEKTDLSEYCTKISCLAGSSLAKALLNARYIICRSGYSSIMDLITLRKPAFLVPTPGQTEQEYLAGYLSENHFFPSCRQHNFNLSEVLQVLRNYTSHFQRHEPDFAYKVIHDIEEW